MRCSECKTELPEGALKCPSCGKTAKPEKHNKKTVIILAVVLAALIIAAVAAGIALNKAGHGCAPQKETDAGVSPGGTDAPSIGGTPADPSGAPDNSGEPDAGATFLPGPDIVVVNHALRTDDTPPIDALVSFMLNGDPDSARKALPSAYITYLADQYGIAAKLFGENNVVRVAGVVVKKNLTDQYGEVSDITYELISRRTMTETEMQSAITELKAVGVEDVPTEGHRLDLRLIINGEQGEQSIIVGPRVILIDGVWYLHPSDIDALTS